MIRDVVCSRECELVLARARLLGGADEQYLAPDWLARPDIYCVAQENGWSGFHDDAESLAQAFACFPDARWFAVATAGREHIRDAVEVCDPVHALTTTADDVSFWARYNPVGTMLFSLTDDAVILHSSEREYRLIAGSAEFVRAYIDASTVDPVEELREIFRANIEWARKGGNDDWVEGFQRTLNMALSQVKLPPPASDLGRPLTPEGEVNGDDPGDR